MNSFNEPTEKTGYLEQDFRLFHIKDQTKREFSYHYHDFHKVIIFLSGKAATKLISATDKAVRLFLAHTDAISTKATSAKKIRK